MFFPIGPVLQWIFLKSYILLRGLLKGFLRRCTRLCELQRLCYGDNLGARRTLAVEKSITLSRSPVFQKIHNELGNIALANELEKKWQLVEKAIEAICVVKGIDCKIHEDFPQPLRVCLTQIYGYQQLLVRLDNVRSIDFDHSNESHRLLLRKLWQQLQPDNTSALDSTLIGKHWKDIGFQGSDPATDFRGMGLLSLENLVFFATVFEDHARNILSHSLHPTLGFPFAAVGINITHLALGLVKLGYLKTHLYNAEKRLYTVEDFHKIYSYLYVSFDKLWIRSKPASVMEFSHIRDKFEAAVIKKLKNTDALFNWDPYLESI